MLIIRCPRLARPTSALRRALVLAAILTSTFATTFARAQGGPPPPPPPPPIPPVPPVPVPLANPITEPKRILGKMLFWEEQVSMNNAVACGSCHIPSQAGTDPRIAIHPGTNLNNPADDRRASPGIARSDDDLHFIRDAIFGTAPQVTDRAANSPINAAFAPQLFWDGRADGRFIDPETGAIAINAGGALESQAVNPPVSSVEMAHDGINWTTVNQKLASVRPMDLATNIPADISAALAGGVDYPELFRRAFGDSAITARRIAFAIATYQRTLISDQTPWDRFNAGTTTALTAAQQRGLGLFTGPGRCNACHATALFTGNGFRNIGLRPEIEDTGLQQTTGQPADAGKFKVPGLRNVARKATFMHNGQFSTIAQVLGFYAAAANGPLPGVTNRDPVMATINLPPPGSQGLLDLEDFLRNGLADPRVSAETAPFDRPTLASQTDARRVTRLGTGTPGAGNINPRILVDMPPMIGTEGYRVGLDAARGGSRARLAVSTNPPINNIIIPQFFLADLITSGTGNGNGLGTVRFTLDPAHFTSGQTLYLQWIVSDPSAIAGTARSDVARLPIFCGNSGCAPACVSDYNSDQTRNLDDLSDLISDFFAYPPIPGGIQPEINPNAFSLGFGQPCAAAANAPDPYTPDAYRAFGYRVGFSSDGSNSCPLDPAQTFPNLDHLSDFITLFYSQGC